MTLHDWKTATISAACSDEDCEWERGEEVLLNAYESAVEHANETGHEVNVSMVSVRKITPS